jgi:hypothetical protein
MPQTPPGACSLAIWRSKNRFVQHPYRNGGIDVMRGQKRCSYATVRSNNRVVASQIS